MLWTPICMYVGFHEDNNRNTFGIWKKGIDRPLSDFNFHYTMKVLCDKSISTGYLVSVLQERIDETDNERSARYVHSYIAMVENYYGYYCSYNLSGILAAKHQFLIRLKFSYINIACKESSQFI